MSGPPISTNSVPMGHNAPNAQGPYAASPTTYNGSPYGVHPQPQNVQLGADQRNPTVKPTAGDTDWKRKDDMIRRILANYKSELPADKAEQLDRLINAMESKSQDSRDVLSQLKNLLGADLYGRMVAQLRSMTVLPTPVMSSAQTATQGGFAAPPQVTQHSKPRAQLATSAGAPPRAVQPAPLTKQPMKSAGRGAPTAPFLKHSGGPLDEPFAKRQRLVGSSVDSIPMPNRGPLKPGAAAAEEDELGGDDGEVQNIKALMDVTKIAGVDLKQEIVFGAPEEEPTDVLVSVTPDPLFLNSDAVRPVIQRIVRERKLTKVSEDIYGFLSLAVQERMRCILEQLVVASHHRLDVVRDQLSTMPGYEPRKALNLIAKREKELKERKEQEERERQLQEAKRLEALAKKDPNTQSLLIAKEQVKRLTNEGEEMRKAKATNSTALQAIGERRKTPQVRVLSTSLNINNAPHSRLSAAQLAQLADLTQLAQANTISVAQQADLAWLQAEFKRGQQAPLLPPSTVALPQVRQVERVITKKDLLFCTSMDPLLRNSRRVLLQQWTKKDEVADTNAS